jgi:hypothetical protein
MRRSPQRGQRRPPKPGFTDEVKAAVRRRSRGICEIRHDGCTGRASHFHHRKLRGHGDHSEANCLHLCAVGHAEVHADPAVSYLLGWLVHSWDDPAAVPLHERRAPRHR